MTFPRFARLRKQLTATRSGLHAVASALAVTLVGFCVAVDASAHPTAQSSQSARNAHVVWLHRATLVPTDETGRASLGYSVAISANGATVMGGGINDKPLGSDVKEGGAWAFVHTAAGWRQQGSKLHPSDANYAAGDDNFGMPLSLTADGDTAIIGGSNAEWLFQRTNGLWQQQGSRIDISSQPCSPGPTDDLGDTAIGGSLGSQRICARTATGWIEEAKLPSDLAWMAISGDGATVLAATLESPKAPASAVFFRDTATGWALDDSVVPSQQSGRPVGNGHGGDYLLTWGALNYDGTSAIVADQLDSNGGKADRGAVWFLQRTTSGWSQVGAKFAPPLAAGAELEFGRAVAISRDGSTAAATSMDVNHGIGMVWTFTRTGQAWRQGGAIAAPSGSKSGTYFGAGVALSANGKTIAIGAPGAGGIVHGVEGAGTGAIYVYTR